MLITYRRKDRLKGVCAINDGEQTRHRERATYEMHTRVWLERKTHFQRPPMSVSTTRTLVDCPARAGRSANRSRSQQKTSAELATHEGLRTKGESNSEGRND